MHYRQAPYAALKKKPAHLAAAARAPESSDHRLRIAGGKNVWEIVPRELEDKGAAVRRELAAIRFHAMPVYAGDDLSDEPAFAALRHGITVYVGRIRPTHAHFRLADAGEVRQFLEKLRVDFALTVRFMTTTEQTFSSWA